MLSASDGLTRNGEYAGQPLLYAGDPIPQPLRDDARDLLAILFRDTSCRVCMTMRGHLTQHGHFLDSIPFEQVRRRVRRAAPEPL